MIAYLALAVVSAATLAYEILLVRLFAIVQWHHFAFMAISIALLGFGASGTMLAIIRDWAKPRFIMLFAMNAALFGLFAPLSFLLVQELPFNALAVVWQPSQLLYLPIMYLLLALPFFFGATCIGLAFIAFGDRIGQVYAFNLIGSAAGTLAAVALLFLVSPTEILKLLAAWAFVAAGLGAMSKRALHRKAMAAVTAALAVLIVFALPQAWFELKMSEFKSLPGALKVSGAKLIKESSSPLGLLSVVESPDVPFRYVPGLSLNAPTLPPDQVGVFIDGDSMTAITRFDGRRDTLAYLDYTTDAAPYHLLAGPTVLVLGAGGGRNVLQALYHRARRIDAVELNPDMHRLIKTNYADYAGHIYGHPTVHVHLAEARGFVAAGKRKWDVIQIPLLDSVGAAAAGVHGLSETYLYTVEAFEHYLRRLEDGGWLCITRWLRIPPRDTLRLLGTALKALERLQAARPARQLILLRGLTTATILVKSGPITAVEITKIRAFAEKRSFDIAYFPGMRADEANRFNVLDEPYLFSGARALIGPRREEFLKRYKFDVAPTTDDRPYFFDFFKWRSLPEFLRMSRAGGAGLLDLGTPILFSTFLQAAALSAVLILAPLFARRRRIAAAGGRGAVVIYFLTIGLAFLFVEIAFIQKFILFLSHPVYAVAVVLTAFLFFAGLGSGFSSRLARNDLRRHVTSPIGLALSSPLDLAIGGIVILSICYVIGLSWLFEPLMLLPDLAKISLSLLLIAPLAFCMGLPFPLGLMRVAAQSPELVPWAWGVNGCASVLSAILATIIAMSLGFAVVVLTAAVLYVAAGAAFRRY